MSSNIITLGNEVVISDPCYTIPTWCQYKTDKVLPGQYHTFVNRNDRFGWGMRNTGLLAVHEDFVSQPLKFRRIAAADIGVDSGQAGIFDLNSYRNDDVFKNEVSEFAKKYRSGDKDGGEEWYCHMADRTLSEIGWGSYSHGVVSSSGIGDGSYILRVAKHKGKIVALFIDFGIDYFGDDIIQNMYLQTANSNPS